MKITVVIGSEGNIVAAHHGEAIKMDKTSLYSESRPAAGLMAGPGQEIHELDVPDTLANALAGHELEANLKTVLATHLKSRPKK